MDEIIRMDYPPIVLNEADKLCEDVLLYIIDMYNGLEDRTGIILPGTDRIKRRMSQGLQHNKKGCREINSRTGRRLYELDATTAGDVYAVCVANGVQEKEKINFVIKDAASYDFDLRRVKKTVLLPGRKDGK